MSGWIKLEKDLISDPRVRRIARQLRNADVTHERISDVTQRFSDSVYLAIALGALTQLWCYADTHVRDDDTLELGIDDIDEIVGVEGFARVLPEDWLQVLDAETVKLPGFHAHNGTDARKKALTQKRVTRHREKVTLQSINRKRNGNAHVTLNALPDQDQDQDRKSKNLARSAPSEPAEFLDFKLAYPERAGDRGWRKAQKAANTRIAEGHSWAEMIAGAKRYAAFVRSTGNIGTEYVKQAATFLGPEKPFLEPWTLPKSKAENQLADNLRTSQEWLSAAQ